MNVSSAPQPISDAAWYYENPRSIEIILDVNKLVLRGGGFASVIIPARKLEKSLARMKPPKTVKHLAHIPSCKGVGSNAPGGCLYERGCPCRCHPQKPKKSRSKK